MFKKSLLAALVLSSVGTFTASAFAVDSIAPICPSADTIKTVQLTTHDASKHGHGKMTVKTVNSFGTDHQWTFSLSGFHLKHNEDLLVKVNSVLSTLSGNNPQVATLHKRSNTWVCVYNAEQGFKAKAHTPA